MIKKNLLRLTSYFLIAVSYVWAQGSLDPPGAPAPTMKTLVEAEPRRHITSIPFTITASGSYYLGSSLTETAGVDGITVNADNVVIDLNGFTISGGGVGVHGINLGTHENVTVRNGTVRDWLGDGVEGSSATNCVFTAIQAFGNAVGIAGGTDARIEKCNARNNSGTGIEVVSGGRIVDNISDDNGGASLHAVSTNNLIKFNQLTDSNIGLDIDGTGNYVADNTVNGNSDNYSIVDGNNLRLLISEIPETIEWDGAHVLVIGDLTGQNNQNGLTIEASHLEVDLGGHALNSGGGTAGDGIFIAGTGGMIQTNLYIHNGSLIGWGDEGINANSARSSVFENLRVSNNQADGILTGRDNKIINCTAMNNGVDGIDGDFSCIIKDCIAMNNGDNGIESNSGTIILDSASYQNGDPTFNIGNGINVSAGCSIIRCSATDNQRFGFNVGNAGNVKDCVASLNNSNGFFVAAAAIIDGCTSRLNDGHGITASTDTYILNCQADQNDNSGIRIVTSDIRIDNNHCTDNGRFGIEAAGTGGSLIVRNSGSGNVMGQYSIAAGHHSGQILVNPGVGFVASNPWANFEY